jgi:hypothetical protein
MPTINRPEFPAVLSVKSAAQYIRDLTRWVGPGFHPDTDFREYYFDTNMRSYTDIEADILNSELEIVRGFLELQNIDTCEIGLPIQRKLLLQRMLL